MPTEIKEIKFFEGRKHIISGRNRPIRHGEAYEEYKTLSPEQINERKQEKRRQRAENIRNNPDLQAYITWIKGIQERLGISTVKFAKRIGCSLQTVKFWKCGRGHFPSERNFKRLLQLERESMIKVTVIKFKVGKGKQTK